MLKVLKFLVVTFIYYDVQCSIIEQETTNMTTTTQKDAILDYIANMMDAVYIARNPEIAKSERRKMLRETNDDLYNLKHYIINEVD